MSYLSKGWKSSSVGFAIALLLGAPAVWAAIGPGPALTTITDPGTTGSYQKMLLVYDGALDPSINNEEVAYLKSGMTNFDLHMMNLRSGQDTIVQKNLQLPGKGQILSTYNDSVAYYDAAANKIWYANNVLASGVNWPVSVLPSAPNAGTGGLPNLKLFQTHLISIQNGMLSLWNLNGGAPVTISHSSVSADVYEQGDNLVYAESDSSGNVSIKQIKMSTALNGGTQAPVIIRAAGAAVNKVVYTADGDIAWLAVDNNLVPQVTYYNQVTKISAPVTSKDSDQKTGLVATKNRLAWVREHGDKTIDLEGAEFVTTKGVTTLDKYKTLYSKLPTYLANITTASSVDYDNVIYTANNSTGAILASGQLIVNEQLWMASLSSNPKTVTLTISIPPTSGVMTVTSSPMGINCSNDPAHLSAFCTATFDYGSPVTLTTSAASPVIQIGKPGFDCDLNTGWSTPYVHTIPITWGKATSANAAGLITEAKDQEIYIKVAQAQAVDPSTLVNASINYFQTVGTSYPFSSTAVQTAIWSMDQAISAFEVTTGNTTVNSLTSSQLKALNSALTAVANSRTDVFTAMANAGVLYKTEQMAIAIVDMKNAVYYAAYHVNKVTDKVISEKEKYNGKVIDPKLTKEQITALQTALGLPVVEYKFKKLTAVPNDLPPSIAYMGAAFNNAITHQLTILNGFPAADTTDIKEAQAQLKDLKSYDPVFVGFFLAGFPAVGALPMVPPVDPALLPLLATTLGIAAASTPAAIVAALPVVPASADLIGISIGAGIGLIGSLGAIGLAGALAVGGLAIAAASGLGILICCL